MSAVPHGPAHEAGAPALRPRSPGSHAPEASPVSDRPSASNGPSASNASGPADHPADAVCESQSPPARGTVLLRPWRKRYLPAMTPAQIAALPDKAWAPVIVATGAIEQHGPHLPVAVDSLMGQAWIALANEYLPEDASFYVAPAITVGKSNEHTGFPGTLMISKATLRAQLLAIGAQISAWGFRSMAVLNTHGGNTAVVMYTLREIRATLGLRTEFLMAKMELDVPLQEKMFGYHANEAETSWILALAGRHVRMDLARCEFPAHPDDPGELRPEQAAATMSWTSQDLSRFGIMGDATAGTEEKGRRWLEHGGRKYAEAIAQLAREMKAAAETEADGGAGAASPAAAR